jgi:competence protein ComEC
MGIWGLTVKKSPEVKKTTIIRKVSASPQATSYLNKIPKNSSIPKSTSPKDTINEPSGWTAWLTRLIDSIREKAVVALRRGLGEPQGSLLVGMVLGVKQQIPTAFYNQLVNTGTVHVIAASGFNLNMVVFAVRKMLLVVVKRRQAAAVAITAVWFYATIAGLGPAITRAAIMASMVLVAELLGKAYAPKWALGLTMVVMLVINSTWISDVGFWLSVAATAGMLWLEKPLERTLQGLIKPVENSGWGKVISQFVIGGLATTGAAYLATLPIIVVAFGRFNPLAIIVNLLIAELVTPIMLLGSIQLLIGLFWVPFALFGSALVLVPLKVFTLIIEVFGSYSGISLVQESFSKVFTWCVALFLLVIYLLILFTIFRYGAKDSHQRSDKVNARVTDEL